MFPNFFEAPANLFPFTRFVALRCLDFGNQLFDVDFYGDITDVVGIFRLRQNDSFLWNFLVDTGFRIVCVAAITHIRMHHHKPQFK